MTDRYSRLTFFSPIGKQGHRQLRQASVLIVGAGALGGPNADMLVRAGVGSIRLIDRDYVDWSNLQRQMLFDEQDVQQMRPKAIAAGERLASINRDVHIEPIVADVTRENIHELLEGIDVILDCTDNFEVRYLLNDAACQQGIPWVYGACVGAYGATLTVVPGETPCLACLFGEDIPEQRETCDTTGVIAPAPHMVASYQAAEVLKLLTGNKNSLRRTFVSFDLWKNEHVEINVDKKRRPTCSACGEQPSYVYLNGEKGSRTAVLCGRDTVQVRLRNVQEWDLEAVAANARAVDREVLSNSHLVSFRADDHRLVVFKDGRVLVHHTNDEVTARRLCAKYLGM